ncbi:MAG: hypothetical protein KDK04_31590, partial [Candidatus Competibacteraceae bacterium]|nr:hypothetical protein [Candidatus Competibacteraceae bacterium]
GSLDLNFRGNYKAVEPLQKMFATAILHLDELPPNPKENRPYILDQLSQRNFSFNYEAGSGIKDVVVKKLRLASRIKKGDRITIEANTDQNRNAVYDLYDQIGQTVPLDLYDVTQVELEATVVVDALKPVKTVTIRLTHPRSCSLKYDALDIKLREMLIASGIEFVEREALEELPDTVDA